MSIINVRKLSKSFNDIPRLSQLVCGGARLSGASRGSRSVLSIMSWQCLHSSGPEVWEQSEEATRLDGGAAPTRQAAGDARATGMRQEGDSPCEEGHRIQA